MVVAIAQLSFRPRKYALIVAMAIRIPWIPSCFIVAGVRIPTDGSRGFSFSISLVLRSIPMAIAGRESVTRLINSRCTGKNGTCRDNREAASTQIMPDRLPDSR